MKLLFDQNISYKLVKQIIDIFPGSRQVKEFGLENATDIKIFNYAKRNGFVVDNYGCLEIIE